MQKNADGGLTDLPREEDNIISGYLGLVAIWVTHPLCPQRMPFNCNVSLIFRFVKVRLTCGFNWIRIQRSVRVDE